MKCGICHKDCKEIKTYIWICGKLLGVHTGECLAQAWEYWKTEGSLKEDNKK